MNQLNSMNRKQQRLNNIRNFSKLKLLLKTHYFQSDILRKKVSDMLSNLYYGYLYIVVIRMIVKGTKHSSRAVKNFINLLTTDITIDSRNLSSILEEASSLPVLNQLNYELLKTRLYKNNFEEIYLIPTEEANACSMLPFCEPKIPKFKSNISNLFSRKSHSHSWHNNGGVLDIVELMNDLAVGMVDRCDVMEILFDPLIWQKYNFASGIRPHDKMSIIITGYDYKGNPGYHKSAELGLINTIPKIVSKKHDYINTESNKNHYLTKLKAKPESANNLKNSSKRLALGHFENRLALVQDKYEEKSNIMSFENCKISILPLDDIFPKFHINQNIKMMIDH